MVLAEAEHFEEMLLKYVNCDHFEIGMILKQNVLLQFLIINGGKQHVTFSMINSGNERQSISIHLKNILKITYVLF